MTIDQTSFDFSLPVFNAIEFRGVEPGGRSQPLRIAGRNVQDSATKELIVKLADPQVGDGTPWRLCLMRELVSALILTRLGLAVPSFGIVSIGDAFIRSLEGHPQHDRLLHNRGLHFGSTVIENVLVHAASGVSLDSWRDTLTFDALAFNADRMSGNPNVLWNGLDLYLIDHGHVAPTWTADVDGLTGSSLFGTFNIRLHAAFVFLVRTGQSYEKVRDEWKDAISEEFLTSAIAKCPESWATKAEREDLLSFLAARRQIADAQADELLRVTQ